MLKKLSIVLSALCLCTALLGAVAPAMAAGENNDPPPMAMNHPYQPVRGD